MSRRGLGIVSGQYPALTDTSPAGIMAWANELIRMLNLKDAIANAAATGYVIEDGVAAKRDLNATTGTAQDVREVLATLIADLLASGKVGK